MARVMPMELAVAEFAELLVDGVTQAEAYKRTHPDCKMTGNALRVKACQFAHRAEVTEAIAKRQAQVRERHERFRDALISHLCDEIEQCWQDNRTLAPVMEQVKTTTRVLGMDKQVVDVKAQVGPIDSDTAADRINFLAKKAKGGK